MRKKYVLLCLFVSCILSLSGCGSRKVNQETKQLEKEIVLGFYIGPYREHFTAGVQPILEKQGYQIKIKDFTDPIIIATALQEGDIDASFSMSTAYAEGFNEDHGTSFVRASYTTSAPQGLYSLQHDALTAIKDGMIIGVPNDPVNEERAFRILEQLGWVTISEQAKVTNFSIDSVTPAKYKLEFKEMDSTKLPSALPDVDYAILNGNIAIDAGYSIGQDALFVEDTPNRHRLTMIVNQENQDADWVTAIREAYLSKEFNDYYSKQLKPEGFLAPIPNDKN